MQHHLSLARKLRKQVPPARPKGPNSTHRHHSQLLDQGELGDCLHALADNLGEHVRGGAPAAVEGRYFLPWRRQPSKLYAVRILESFSLHPLLFPNVWWSIQRSKYVAFRPLSRTHEVLRAPWTSRVLHCTARDACMCRRMRARAEGRVLALSSACLMCSSGEPSTEKSSGTKVLLATRPMSTQCT
jgi:hypothetical protein